MTFKIKWLSGLRGCLKKTEWELWAGSLKWCLRALYYSFTHLELQYLLSHTRRCLLMDKNGFNWCPNLLVQLWQTLGIILDLSFISSEIFPTVTLLNFYFCVCSSCSRVLQLHHAGLCTIEAALDRSADTGSDYQTLIVMAKLSPHQQTLRHFIWQLLLLFF